MCLISLKKLSNNRNFHAYKLMEGTLKIRKYFRRADSTQKEDSYEVIVCHANVIRYFVCRAIQGCRM